MKSSQAAFDLIVEEEVTNEAYYTHHYQHFDWPKGQSGPTVGVGYDCGYVTQDELRTDWAGIATDDAIAAMLPACGKRAGEAEAFVNAHRASVTITWDQAIAEFRDREMPKWEARVAAALPNTDQLSPDSFGALVSLAYNRGASFNAPGARETEMRAIRDHMAARDFDKIPAEFLAMRRLWPPKGSDLWNRREHEAALFQRGLAAPAATAGGGPAQAAGPSGGTAAPVVHGTRWVQDSLNRLGANPPLTVDGNIGPATRAAIVAFQTRAGITADGDAGPTTMAKIEQALAAG